MLPTTRSRVLSGPDKHELAAGWIEQLSADRDDAVEMRAHHLVQALEYADAAGQDTSSLREAARLALRAAGDRAHRVDAHEAAVRHRRAALELTAADDPDRGYAVLDMARSLARLGVDCEPELETAIELLLPRDRAAAAHAHTILSGVRSSHGDGEGRQWHVQRALELVEGAPVSLYHARVLLNCAMNAVVNTEMPEAIRLLDAYLAVAEQAGVEPRDIFTAHAYRGGARVECGDPGGLDEESQAIQGMRELGDSELSISLGNHATVHLVLGHVERYRELAAESLEWGLRRTPWRIGGPTAEVAVSDYLAGAWPDALARISAFIEARGGYGGEFASFVLGTQARVLARQGVMSQAVEVEARALRLAREEGMPQSLCPELAESAWLALERGDDAQAGELLDELFVVAEGSSALLAALPYAGAELAESAERTRRTARLEAAARAMPLETPWKDALLASVAGDHAAAAELYTGMGSLTDAAFAHLRAAEQLTAQGHAAEAGPHLQAARRFYESVGGALYLERTAQLAPDPQKARPGAPS